MKATSIHSSIAKNYSYQGENKSIFAAFHNWTILQQKNRLMWLGIALTTHGCILTPLTLAVIMLNGVNMYLFMLAMVAMAAVLVTNLAASPTKITIPVYFLSIIVDIAIIIITMASLIIR